MIAGPIQNPIMPHHVPNRVFSVNSPKTFVMQVKLPVASHGEFHFTLERRNFIYLGHMQKTSLSVRFWDDTRSISSMLLLPR